MGKSKELSMDLKKRIYIPIPNEQPVATVARKNSLRQQEEETLRGTRLKREPIFIWVTDSAIITTHIYIHVLCGDTVFIVLRKQRLMFLHWYHHITVLLYSWFTYRERAAGGCFFFTMNFTVHSLMYSYYAAKAARLRLPRPCAMIITALQILQMAVGLTVLALVYRWQNDTVCRSTVSNITWGFLMYLTYLLLFVSFFYQSYVKRGKKDMAGQRRVKSE